ncbi:hypothetical protein KQ313_00750 [Synechococcus sp. CS-1325]|uniref:hypothetical protein n=1 Tax=unclassified Synechococcus TaxID=2626047 RepID=UPI000DB64068|nr:MULTISPECIES: hypothetical protein [unclassified Synechococcus]PZU99150.1 MAG: hypothetical protein DCF24_09630 [Cyanobium sp.]MCT0198222.1 hypothetical protein [Synechococcus sp. CS-1325]MCT0213695.1 hypothetical protein [Synechococcus sp. CS-1326]MCT0229538.1 hypothetical protein [Synechococcus sp. CS-1324]MCT0234088.1 hypothetical protein [Synechococcus sp. CS-1327]
MPEHHWLVRPRRDGGSDYVHFLARQENVEVLEGTHLPPQMPLLKSRHWLAPPEAEARCRDLQETGGYQACDPLF